MAQGLWTWWRQAPQTPSGGLNMPNCVYMYLFVLYNHISSIDFSLLKLGFLQFMYLCEEVFCEKAGPVQQICVAIIMEYTSI